MNNSNPDALAFELVDLEDAKQALDNAVVNTHRGGLDDLPKLNCDTRTPVRAAPQAPEELPPATIQWIISLPALCRPLYLTKSFPKIANKLALLWPDRELTQNYFNDLLMDTRGGRQGFPREVFDDLMRLLQHFNKLHGIKDPMADLR